MTQAAHQNLHVNKYLQQIVAAVQEAVDSGEKLPWHSPYFLTNMKRLVNPFRNKDFQGKMRPEGTPYSGLLNTLVLTMAAQAAAKRRGVSDSRFVPMSTMKELYDKGARIRSNPCKKEKKESLNDYIVIQVFYPRTVTKIVPNPEYDTKYPESDNNQPTKKIQVPTGHFGLGRVINVADTNLVEIGILPKLDSYFQRENPPIEVLETLISRFPHTKVEEMETPHYNLRTKEITTPPINKARSSLGHYGTMIHELAHQIGDMLGEIQPTFEIDKYSEEELNAEMTKSYVFGSLGFVSQDSDDDKNSIAYVRGWLSRLNDDPEILLRAANAAKRRGDFILKGSVPLSLVKNPDLFPFLQNSPSLAA